MIALIKIADFFKFGSLPFHPRVVTNALAILLATGGVAMLTPAAYSFVVNDGVAAALGLPAIAAICWPPRLS